MKPSQLRQEIAGHLALQLGPDWSESGFPFDLFPDLESRDGHHLSFAVGLPSSTAMPARQRGHLPVQTAVAVAFTVQLQADALRESYDEALDAEMTMLRALTSVKDGAGRQPLTITSIERQVVEDVHVFVGIVHATVPHPICLD